MKKNGFTLVELAIVLAVIGILLGGGFKFLKMQREKEKTQEAKFYVKEAKDAIVGYATKYVDLPTWSEFANELSPLKSKVDDLNKTFFYFADPNLANDQDICTFDTTNLNVEVYQNGSLDHTIDNVAFVVAAQGANGNIQTGVSGSSPYVVKVYDYSAKEDDNSYDYTREENYDDIVKWMTLDELQTAVRCSDNKLTFVTDSALPRDIISSTDYLGSGYATIRADQGYPFDDGSDSDSDQDYKWCIENVPSWLNNIQCGSDTITTGSHDCNDDTNYKQCTQLQIDGNPSTRGSAGTDYLRVYAKDKTKTINKLFSITLDTDTSSGSGGSGGSGGSAGSGSGFGSGRGGGRWP